MFDVVSDPSQEALCRFFVMRNNDRTSIPILEALNEEAGEVVR